MFAEASPSAPLKTKSKGGRSRPCFEMIRPASHLLRPRTGFVDGKIEIRFGVDQKKRSRWARSRKL
jgi:hypothetical protein